MDLGTQEVFRCRADLCDRVRTGEAVKRLIITLLVVIPVSVWILPTFAESELMTLDVSCSKNDKGVSMCLVPESQLDKLIGYANTATKVLGELKAQCSKGKWT